MLFNDIKTSTVNTLIWCTRSSFSRLMAPLFRKSPSRLILCSKTSTAAIKNLQQWHQCCQYNNSNNKSVFSVMSSAVNVKLPIFAAEHCTVAPLMLSAATCCRLLSPAYGELRSKPVTLPLLLNNGTNGRMEGQTDGQADKYSVVS